MYTTEKHSRPVLGREDSSMPGYYHFTAKDLVKIEQRLDEIIEAGECETNSDATDARFIDAIATNAISGNAELCVADLKVIDRECISGRTKITVEPDGLATPSSICWSVVDGCFLLIGTPVFIRRDRADRAEIVVVESNDGASYLQIEISLEPKHFDTVLHVIERKSDDEVDANPTRIQFQINNFLHDDGKLVDGIRWIKTRQQRGNYQIDIYN